MTEIIGVRFKSGGKVYYFNPEGMKIPEETDVIVETARGMEYGLCVQSNTQVAEEAVTEPLRSVVRLATEDDRRMREANRKKEGWAMEVCQQKILAHRLDMKLVNVEYNFDGSKILFFFTSDGRVDFRELVKDLASVFRTRIELRQIGVRDEAKMLGGLGICGQPFCCSRFLEEFQPVSIKMAKTQNLSLNPTKISGTCGRLMCCLKYEQEAYEDLVGRVPKQDSFVETPDGVGTVSSVSLLREQAKVRLDIAPETPRCYACQNIKVIRSGKGKRPEGYDPPEVLQAEHIRKTVEQAKAEDAARRAAVPGAQNGQPRKPRAKGRGDWKDSRPPREQREQKEPREPKPRSPKGGQRPQSQPAQKPKNREEGQRPPQQQDKRHPRYHRKGHGRPQQRPNQPPRAEGEKRPESREPKE